MNAFWAILCGMSEIVETPPPLPEHEVLPADLVLFYPTSRAKFIFLSIVTFGLYELYWCYKCWKFVQQNGRPEISPFWRGFLAPLWLYSLQKAINPDTPKNRIMLIAGAYFILNLIAQLPDPYWWLSFFSFVPMLSVVSVVNSLNADPQVRRSSNYSRFGLKHVAVSIACSALLAITFLPEIGLMPPTYVVDGAKISQSHRQFMTELDVFSEDEELILLYSLGIFSFKEDGNFFTDKRVGCYWESYFEEGYEAESAFFEDIKDIAVEYSDSEWIDTSLTVLRHDDTEFMLSVSTEKGLDRDFVDQVLERWRAVQPQAEATPVAMP